MVRAAFVGARGWITVLVVGGRGLRRGRGG